jgi:leader peptidase (prepilin peptidase)/N-methyltransferase
MEMIILAIYIAVLIFASITDYHNYIINDRVHVIIIILSLVQVHDFNYILRIGGAVLIALPFLMLAIKTDKFGGGDIKFIFSNTLFLGFTFSYGSILIGFTLVILHYVWRRISRKTDKDRRIALVPYLSIGYIVLTLFSTL